jgi:large subunit ribosomal protein L17
MAYIELIGAEHELDEKRQKREAARAKKREEIAKQMREEIAKQMEEQTPPAEAGEAKAETKAEE